MGIARRAIVCSILVLVLVSVLLMALSLVRFNALQQRMVQERLSVVGTSIRDAFQGAIDLGIRVEEVRSADALIRRALSSDWNISAIDVVAPSGRVLFSSGNAGAAPPVHVPGARPDTSATPRAPAGSGSALTSSIPISDSFGQVVATLVLTYDGDVLDDQRASLLRDLLLRALFVLLVGGGLTVAGVAIATRGRAAVSLGTLAGMTSSRAGSDELPADMAAMLEAAQREADALERELDAMEAALGAKAGS